jgi:hypothetical protein
MSEQETAAQASDEVLDEEDDGFGTADDYGHELVEDDPDLISEGEDESGESYAEDLEDEELADEESSNFDSPDNKSYKEMQSMYSKTQNKNSELEGQINELENQLKPFGGLEGVVKSLTYVQNDPEYRALTAKKAGQSIPGVDEANLTPEAKEALELVKKTVRAELANEMRQYDERTVKPLADQVRQTNLDSIADSLLETHGEQFQEQLPTIERLAKKLPQVLLDNPTYEIMETLFHESLREDGKAEAYYLDRYQTKVNGKRGKVTGSPKTSGASPNAPKFNKPKTMFDASRIADKRRAYTNKKR